MKITYQDVAERAGVSTASVSRALSGRDGIAPDQAERIRRIAEEMGYRANGAARALRRQRAEAIGLVVSDVENPYFGAVARALEGVAAGQGHSVLLCNTGEDLDAERRYLDLLAGESVAGVVIAPSTEQLGSLELLVAQAIPTVLLDRRLKGDPFDSVMVDHRGTAEALVAHLIDVHGHRRIGVVVGTTAATPSRERLSGAREAASARRAQLRVVEGDLRQAAGVATLDLGERLAAELLHGDDAVTAVFAANNLLSVAVLRALRHHRIQVPGQVALIGFDDQPFFDLLDPPLSAAAQPTEEIGRVAAQRLFARIANPDAPTERVVLPAQLRIRRSCGCTG